MAIIEQKYSFKLNEKQSQFHIAAQDYEYVAFIGGIGSGKSWMGCLEAFNQAFYQPGSVGMVLAPTYTMLRDSTYRTFKENICPPELIISENLTNKELKIRAKDGKTSTILFRSADEPENLRGPNLAWFVLDEAARMSKLTWQIMIGRLRQPGYKHHGYVLTTPKGKDWVWEVFVKNKTDSTALVTCPTHVNQKNLPKEFIQNLETMYVGQFKQQELFGEFTSHDGLVYPGFKQEIHVIENSQILPLDSFSKIVCGIDWGFTNPHAMIAVGFDNDGRAWVIDEVYQTRLQPDQILAYCAEFRDKYHPECFYCDSAEPMKIAMLSSAGYYAIPALKPIMDGISCVSSYLEVQGDNRPRLYVARKCSGILTEFDQYQYPPNKTNGVAVENPIDANNHSLGALRYVLYTMKKSQYTSPQSEDYPVFYGTDL